jgi:hypothetical protein
MQTDGERLPLAVKDLGSSDIYPQSLQHSPNGRFVTGRLGCLGRGRWDIPCAEGEGGGAVLLCCLVQGVNRWRACAGPWQRGGDGGAVWRSVQFVE